MATPDNATRERRAPDAQASGRRRSLLTGLPRITLDDPDHRGDIASERALRRELAARFLGEHPSSIGGNAVVIGALVTLLWPITSHPLLISWIGAAALTIVVRGVVAWIGTGSSTSEAVLPLLRTLSIGSGVCWGIGAAIVLPTLPAEYSGLLLLIMSGVVAAAAGTFAADLMTFRWFAAFVLGPLPFGILARATDRFETFWVRRIGFFFGFMLRLNRRYRQALTRQIRSTATLELVHNESLLESAFLEALFHSVPNAIAVVDRRGRCVATNQGFENLFGYSAEEARGRSTISLLVPPEGREQATLLMAEARRGHSTMLEVERRHRDGHPVYVDLSIAGVAGDDERVIGLYTDLADQKKAEQAMREARDIAERAARARSEFLANMSHEIRTPMNAVLGITELLLDSDLEAEQRRSLRLVQSAGEALLTLLNDILDLSKFEGDHMTLESIPFDLRYLVETTASLLAVRAADRPIELVADVSDDMPALVLGDPTRLRQVLTNLVGNALKFTREGEVVLSAHLQSASNGKASIRFAVRDTGIGIAASQLGAIFEEFTQADASMTRKFGGTGLGLSIARRLVALMGGELTVTSELGRGSEFSFTLLLPVEEAREVANTSISRLNGRRILIVDDNDTNRRIVRGMLEGARAMTGEAADAEGAISALTRAVGNGEPYDVAIIDAQMPGRSGFDLAVDVRANPSLTGVRLLMLTSVGQRGDTSRCRDVGIDGYLPKPASRTNLLEATAALTGGPGGGATSSLVTRHLIAESRPRMRVLLAEDNPVNQQVAATMLRKRGHTVDVVGNGREAVEQVTRAAYDVVLMDIQMPELNGFEERAAARTGPAASVPIIALTAHALTGERERGIGKGMNGYLAKPFRPADLYAIVEGVEANAA